MLSQEIFEYGTRGRKNGGGKPDILPLKSVGS
jgi:hypothetical protein